jgi:hypothetical protein
MRTRLERYRDLRNAPISATAPLIGIKNRTVITNFADYRPVRLQVYTLITCLLQAISEDKCQDNYLVASTQHPSTNRFGLY